MFGSFIKFVVVSLAANSPSQELTCLNSVSQRQLNSSQDKSLPSLILPARNKKDELFNSIVECCSEMGLGWSDPTQYGKPFIGDLCKSLWLIDGHHDVFASRSCHIPSFFLKFVGYNRPERSKHRKRSISNLSRDKLLELAMRLQDHVTSSWIQLPEWETLKKHLMQLIESISSYCAYLAMRCKTMKLHHSSPEPVVNFSDAVNIQSVPPSPSVSPLVSVLDTAISNSAPYHRIHVNEFAPKDCRQRYLYIKELERGLSCSRFFFTYIMVQMSAITTLYGKHQIISVWKHVLLQICV